MCGVGIEKDKKPTSMGQPRSTAVEDVPDGTDHQVGFLEVNTSVAAVFGDDHACVGNLIDPFLVELQAERCSSFLDARHTCEFFGFEIDGRSAKVVADMDQDHRNVWNAAIVGLDQRLGCATALVVHAAGSGIGSYDSMPLPAA